MTWFILLFFAMSGQSDVYIFTEPTFKTSAECIQYVTDNAYPLGSHFASQVGPGADLKSVFCLEAEQLKALMAQPV